VRFRPLAARKETVATALSTDRRARVLYDGHCALCRKSVRLLRRLDWLGRPTYVDVRDEIQLAGVDLGVEPERLLEEMHLIPAGEAKIYHGFGALRWMAWRLPALWLIAPLLYLPGVPEAGQRLYLWVARNRFHLVPCHGGVCTLPHGSSQSSVISDQSSVISRREETDLSFRANSVRESINLQTDD
jgi:predicted DCC family thiol-disulfide oxidoreductase YuxK